MKPRSYLVKGPYRALILGVMLSVLLGAMLLFSKALGAVPPPAVQPEDLLLLTPSAVERVTAVAEEGDLVAQAVLGSAYLQGERVPKSVTMSVFWFEKVAQRDFKEALRGQERMRAILEERDRTINHGKVRRLEVEYLDLAVQKLAREQAMSGLIHIYTGGESALYADPRGAVRTMVQGTRCRVPGAERALGIASLFGFPGVPRNAEFGVFLLRDAAVQHDHGAEYVLGELYASGVGVRKDLAAAEFWFARAAPHLPRAAERLRLLRLQRPSADYLWE